jgi:hypothetical protein
LPPKPKDRTAKPKDGHYLNAIVLPPRTATGGGDVQRSGTPVAAQEFQKVQNEKTQRPTYVLVAATFDAEIRFNKMGGQY